MASPEVPCVHIPVDHGNMPAARDPRYMPAIIPSGIIEEDETNDGSPQFAQI